MYEFKTIIANAKKIAPKRSCWDRGVNLYVSEILENIEENLDYKTWYNFPTLTSVKDLEKIALNGAENWKQYSYGGCSLCYDFEIAIRLCTPSEFERVERGNKQPNSRENWLDVQSRALYQAWQIVSRAINMSMEVNA